MALEPVISEVNYRHKKKLGAVQSYAEIRAEASNGEEIVRILSVYSSPFAASVQVIGGGADAQLVVRSAILAVTATGEIISLTAQGETSCKLAASSLLPEQKVFALPSLIETGSIKTSGSSVSFSCLLETSFLTVASEKIRVIESAGEGAFAKHDNLKYYDLTASASEVFEHAGEADIPSGAARILSVESNAVLGNIVAGADMFTLHGQIISNIIYLTSDDLPKIKNHIQTHEFRQEMLAGGFKPNAECHADVHIFNTEFEVSGEMGNGKGVLNLKHSVSVTAMASTEHEVSCVADAFGTESQLTLTTESFNINKLMASRKFSDKADGNIVLEESSPKIEKILSVSACFVVPTSITPGNNNIVMEGIVYANVIYLNDNDEPETNSVQAEVPFSSSFECEGVTPESILEFTARIADIDARSKKGREIDMQADVVFNVNIINVAVGACLSGIASGEGQLSERAAMGVYVIDKCNELWDAAKRLSVDPKLIEQQNPGLSFPIQEPQSIIIYRQRLR